MQHNGPITEDHPHHISRGKVVGIAVALVIVVVAAWLAGYLPRRSEEAAAAAAADQVRNDIPFVSTAVARSAPSDTEIVLPGSVSAVAEASIYSRASGYVSKRYVDLGDRVKQGQILAEIDAPDLDQQVAGARAAVAQARQQLGISNASLIQAESQRDLAKSTLARYEGLIKDGAVARQDYETQISTAKSAEALVEAQKANISAADENVRQAQANLDRVLALQEYKNIRAPFAGVVTARNVEVGYLISSNGGGQGTSPVAQAGSSQSVPAFGNELFRVAQPDMLRVFIGVPQSSTSALQIGMPAAITFAERPGQEFPGKVTRTSGTLDPAARTMTTEVQIPNSAGKLFPGMYASVHLQVHRDAPPLLIRGDAVIANASGVQVAVLHDAPQGGGAKQVHMTPIQSGRDYGIDIEILSGLQPGAMVVANPSDVVREGAIVRPYANPARGGSGGR